MTLYRVLSGRVKKNGQTTPSGGDLELTAEEAALLNKNGRKTVEPTSVAVAREKAKTDADATVKKAEEEAKRLEADAKKKAEEEKKKGGKS